MNKKIIIILIALVGSLALAKNFGADILRLGDGLENKDSFIYSNQTGNTDPYHKYDVASGRWVFSNDGVRENFIGSGSGSGTGINLITENSGFEDGAEFFTAPGTSFSVETTSPLFGESSGIFNPGALGDIFESPLLDVPVGMLGSSCSTSFTYTWSGAQGELLVEIKDQANNVLISNEILPSSQSNKFQNFFTCPSTAGDKIKFTIRATAGTSAMLLDNVFLGTGESSLITSLLVQESTRADGGSTGTSNVTNFQNVTHDGSNELISTYQTDGTFLAVKRAQFVIHCSGNSTNSTSGAAVNIDGVNVSTENVPNNTFDSAASWSGILNAGSTMACRSTGPGMNVMQISISAITEGGSAARIADLSTTGSLLRAEHKTDCAFSKSTSTAAYTPFNADSTCTFQVENNIGFKNVATKLNGSDSLPGISLEFPYPGEYKVCAKAQHFGGNSTASVQLVKNGTEVLSSSVHFNGSLLRIASNYCSIVKVTDTSSVDLEFIALTSSSVNFSISSNAAVDIATIEWNIHPINQGKPAPVIMEVQEKIKSNFSGTKLVSCFLKFNSVGTVDIISSSETCDWIDSTTRLGVGRGEISMVPGTFSNDPNCIADYHEDSSFVSPAPRACNASTSGGVVDISCRIGSSASAGFYGDSEFYLICHGK